MASFLKSILAGSAVVASLAPAMALAADNATGPTCAYVIGQVNGKTVTTPAQLIIVPSSDALAQPITVHLDETSQNIIGYSLTAPGANGGTNGSPIFVPGASQYIPSFSATIPDLPLTTYRCLDFNSVNVPAVPVKIPSSALQLPGVVANVGGAVFNFAGNPFTAPGQLFTFDGKTVFVPAFDQATPAANVGTPNKTITLDLNNPNPAAYLPPHN